MLLYMLLLFILCSSCVPCWCCYELLLLLYPQMFIPPVRDVWNPFCGRTGGRSYPNVKMLSRDTMEEQRPQYSSIEYHSVFRYSELSKLARHVPESWNERLTEETVSIFARCGYNIIRWRRGLWPLLLGAFFFCPTPSKKSLRERCKVSRAPTVEA